MARATPPRPRIAAGRRRSSRRRSPRGQAAASRSSHRRLDGVTSVGPRRYRTVVAFGHDSGPERVVRLPPPARRFEPWTTLLDLLDEAVAAIRRQDRAQPPTRRRLDHALDVPRARPAVAHRRLAAARARARAGRPAADLVAVDAGPAGDLFRGDAGRPDPRPARPAHVHRRDRGHRPDLRRQAPDPRHRA